MKQWSYDLNVAQKNICNTANIVSSLFLFTLWKLWPLGTGIIRDINNHEQS